MRKSTTKKLIFTLLMAGLVISTAQAQLYKLKTESNTYTPLTDATVLNPAEAGNGWYVARNMEFPVFSTQAGFEFKMNVSRGAWISPEGYLAVYDKPTFKSTIIFHVMYRNGMEFRSGSSQVSYRYEGTAGSGTWKFEWKNMHIKDAPATEMANYQLWFNEGTKEVSYHYGPNTIESAAGCYTGIWRTTDFSDLHEAYCLSGSSTMPVANEPKTITTIPYLEDFPAEGTVYTFTLGQSGIENEAAAAPATLVYPNPAHDVLYLGKGLNASSAVIYTVDGRVVEMPALAATKGSVDISGLTPGVYLLRWRNADESYTCARFVKE